MLGPRPQSPLRYWSRLSRGQMYGLLKVWQRRFQITVSHGEGRSIFHVVDFEAPEGEQPAVLSSWLSKQAASTAINQTFYRWAYVQFRRTARLDRITGCVLVPWRGMTLGIEPDGYTHS